MKQATDASTIFCLRNLKAKAVDRLGINERVVV
jgi:hypothetical protein